MHYDVNLLASILRITKLSNKNLELLHREVRTVLCLHSITPLNLNKSNQRTSRDQPQIRLTLKRWDKVRNHKIHLKYTHPLVQSQRHPNQKARFYREQLINQQCDRRMMQLRSQLKRLLGTGFSRKKFSNDAEE